MTKQLTGDLLECGWGCLGRGSCMAACPMGAISMGSSGAAEVDRNKCIGCGLCVKTCSKGLIRLTTPECSVSRASGNQAPGDLGQGLGFVGCFSGAISEGGCSPDGIRPAIPRDGTSRSDRPVDEIQPEKIHAVIDGEGCVSCSMCPVHCSKEMLTDTGGIFYN